jgi:DNA-binding transcriptional LysR family regulator
VRLVGAGGGVSLVPRSVRTLHSAGVAYRPLRDGPATVEMAVAWRRDDESPLLRQFLDVARTTKYPSGRAAPESSRRAAAGSAPRSG